MSDTVIGTAILDRTEKDRTDYLHLLCEYRDKSRHHHIIPVHPKGTQPYEEPSWAYQIDGTTINVAPSLRITTTRPSKTNPQGAETVELFHNDATWSVPFQEFITGSASALFKA